MPGGTFFQRNELCYQPSGSSNLGCTNWSGWIHHCLGKKKQIVFFSDCDVVVIPTPNHLQVILSSRSKPCIFPLLSMVSHIHLKHSIHHQLSFVFAFQWPTFYHTDQSVASQPHVKKTCIRPASTGVSTVFPSPGASYTLTVHMQTQSVLKPVPPHMQKHEYQAQLLWHPANASAPAKSLQS